jgi:hypothetical protein
MWYRAVSRMYICRNKRINKNKNVLKSMFWYFSGLALSHFGNEFFSNFAFICLAVAIYYCVIHIRHTRNKKSTE